MGSARLGGTLPVAAAVHALVLYGLLTSVPPRRSPAGSGLPVVESWIDVEARVETADEAEKALPADPARGGSVAARPAEVEARETHAASPSSQAPVLRSALAAVAAPDSAGETWTFSPLVPAAPAPSSFVLGPGVAAGVTAMLNEEAKRTGEASARHRALPSVGAKDYDLGLVAGGELVNVARDFVRTSLTPTNGRARLEVVVDGAGHVIAVRVLDASAGRHEWDALAEEIAASPEVSGLKVRVPSSSSRGMVVTLEISSALKYADGSAVREKKGVAETVGAIVGTIIDPLDAIVARSTPPRRMVSVSILSAEAATPPP